MSTQVRASHVIGGLRLEARHGDLCKEEVGAIVNAANEFLRHGGGVARAIADAAGCGGIVNRSGGKERRVSESQGSGDSRTERHTVRGKECVCVCLCADVCVCVV